MLGSKIKLKTGSAIGPGSAGSLKTASAISGTLQTVTDTAGNNSALKIATATIQIGSGTITQNGVLTVKGSGGNIVNFRNSSNVECLSLDNTGLLVTTNTISAPDFNLNAGQRAISSGTAIILLTNNGYNNFDRLVLGTNDVNGISIAKSGTNMRFALGNNSALTSIFSKDYTSDNLTAGTLTTARPMRFGDRATITEAGFIALGLNRQIAIEHNGVVYYIPVSTTLIP
jgi:hypothetical protein